MKNLSKTNLFFLVVIVLCSLLVGTFMAFGGEYQSIWGTLMATAYMFTPMLATIIVDRVVHRQKVGDSIPLSFKINRWFVVAWIVPPVLAFATFGFSLLLPDVTYSADMAGMFSRFEDMMTPEQMDAMRESMDMLPIPIVWITLLQGMLAGITINAVAGFGEELGWRGFMLREYRKISFLKASLIIGVIWGLWHSPIILMGHNYPQHPQLGVLMMTIWCVLLSPLFNYIAIKSKSVIAASILHGTLNATGAISIMMIDGGNDLTTGLTGLAGFMVLVILLIILFVYDSWISKDGIMTSTIEEHLEPFTSQSDSQNDLNHIDT